MTAKTLLMAAVAGLFSVCSARATTIFIGDDAAEGHAVTAGGGTQADTVNPLTYAFTGTGCTYAAATAQTIQLTEVNFFADEGPGNLTPFVALYNGGSNQAGASYKVVSIGDPISVTGSTFGSVGNVLDNATFTVGGVNPQISLNAGDVLVAGLFQSSRIVVVGTSTGSNNDYINTGNSLPATSGSTLTSDSDFGLNRTMQFNIGFTVVPEPSIAGIALISIAAFASLRRRRASSPA